MSGADRKCCIPQLSSKSSRAVRWKGHCTYSRQLQKAKLVVFSVLRPMYAEHSGRESDLGDDLVCGR